MKNTQALPMANLDLIKTIVWLSVEVQIVEFRGVVCCDSGVWILILITGDL